MLITRRHHTVFGGINSVKQLGNVGFNDFAVAILCINAHIHAVGILNGTDILIDFVIIVFEILLEFIEIILFNLGVVKRVYQLIHN